MSFTVSDPVGGIVPDDGGVLVTINSTSTLPTGNYTVTIGNIACRSGVPGQAGVIVPIDNSHIRFVMPPLAVGLHDIIVTMPDKSQVTIYNGVNVQFRHRASEIYTLRRMFPPRRKIGPRLLEDEPILAGPTQYPASIGNLDGFYKSTGEILTRLGGVLETKLIQPATASAVQIYVESTIDWPEKGVFFVDGERISYESTSPTSFKQCFRGAGATIHRKGAVVADAMGSYSQRDQVRNASLVRVATDVDLDVIGSNHNEHRVLALNDDRWRTVLRILLYLERGTWWSLYRILREILADWAVDVATTVSQQYSNRLNVESPYWNGTHIGRPVEIDGVVYRIREVDPDGMYCILEPSKGPWFDNADFPPGVYQTTIEPFRMIVSPALDPGWVSLDFFTNYNVAAPTSHILDSDDPTPDGWPKGSEILPDYDTPGTGMNPWYLPGFSEDSAIISTLTELLPCGTGLRTNVVVKQS